MLLILHISASLCPKNHHSNCLRLLETSGSLHQVCARHQRVYTRSHMLICRQAVVSGRISAVVYHDATLGETDVDAVALSAGLRTPETVDLANNVPILSFSAGQLGR